MKKEKVPPKEARLRRLAEERLKGETTETGPSPAEEDARRMLHELQVHQVELALQNEELTQAREELEKQLEKYSDLYNFAPVGYFTLDGAGTVLEANLTGSKLLGIERSRLVGRPFNSFLSNESRQILEECLREVYEGIAGGTCEVALLTREDLSRYVQIDGAPVESDGGKVRQCRVAMIDITGRRQAEEALKETSRKLAEAKNEVDRIVEERTSELKRAYESLRVETEERRRAEVQLRQSQKMEAIGILAGGIAHDFNNILGAIIGFSEMARDKTPEDSPVRRHMEKVFAAGIRGRELIKAILTFSRKSEQAMQPLKLAALVQETLNFLRASLPSMIDIKTGIQSESGFILADPTQIQQIVMNLCTNAAHATRRTGGSISIDLADFGFSDPKDAPDPTMNPGLYARLSVTDTGEGMSPEILEHIFDPFFTTKAPGEGTGLGLSVVHGIVASHNGTITMSSEPGKGSAFTVYLPKFIEEKARGAGNDAGSPVPRGHESVLFVDDEEDIAAISEEMLTGLGYRVTSRTRPRGALALFKLNPSRFDLVITDQNMPEMTGEELAKEMLAIRPDISIVICTGFSHLLDADSAKAAGIKAFAIKPLTKREMALVVRKVLDE